MRPLKRFLILPLMAAWLSGCAGALIGAGATTGVAAYQERGIEGVAKDLQIESRIIGNWFQFQHALPTKVSVEVYEGRALLTGAVADPQIRADAVRLAWKALEVKEVLNEIQVTNVGDVFDLARDSWITAQLKSKITFDEDILAINYVIETVNGIVYLIGIAQDQAELDRVIAHGRVLGNVKKIISHVRLKGAS
jgi:osmotically-inducible protein OsmY